MPADNDVARMVVLWTASGHLLLRLRASHSACPVLSCPGRPATASASQDVFAPPINRARLASDRVVPSLELALPLDTSTRPQQLTTASPAGFLVHLGHLSRKQYPLGRNCLILALKLAA